MKLASSKLADTNFENADYICEGYRMSDVGFRHLSLYLPLVQNAQRGATPDSKVRILGDEFNVFIATDADGDEVAFITNGTLSTGMILADIDDAQDAPYVEASLDALLLDIE